MGAELRGLEGKVAFVTGAGRGQGANRARGLAEAGCDVVVTDICSPMEGFYDTASKEQLDLTVSQVIERGARGLGVVADVRDEQQMKAAVDQALDAFGRIDVLVNNAGTCSSAMLHEMPIEIWDTLIDVNLKGQAVASKLVIPQMIGRRRQDHQHLVGCDRQRAHHARPLRGFQAWGGGSHQSAGQRAVRVGN